MPDPTCRWCGGEFQARRRGGSEQAYCCPRHRVAFHTAARLWAERAIAAGVLTIADLRNGDPSACTLIGRASNRAVVPARLESNKAFVEACTRPDRSNVEPPRRRLKQKKQGGSTCRSQPATGESDLPENQIPAAISEAGPQSPRRTLGRLIFSPYRSLHTHKAGSRACASLRAHYACPRLSVASSAAGSSVPDTGLTGRFHHREAWHSSMSAARSAALLMFIPVTVRPKASHALRSTTSAVSVSAPNRASKKRDRHRKGQKPRGFQPQPWPGSLHERTGSEPRQVSPGPKDSDRPAP